MTSNPHSYRELKRLMKYLRALLWRPQGFCGTLHHPKSRCVLANKCADYCDPPQKSAERAHRMIKSTFSSPIRELTTFSTRAPHAGDASARGQTLGYLPQPLKFCTLHFGCQSCKWLRLKTHKDEKVVAISSKTKNN